MKTKRIALYGGSFNPPGSHVREITRQLARGFAQVILIPCGPRPEKISTNDIEPLHRAVMLDKTCRGLPRVRVELFDLEQSTFTRTCQLEQRFASEGEIWHVIDDVAFIRGGQNQQSVIQREWEDGKKLWLNSRFVVIVYEDDDYTQKDFPPHSVALHLPPHMKRGKIRDRIFGNESFDHLVLPEVAAYIERYRLYRGSIVQPTTRLSIKEPRAMIVADERNPTAIALAKRFERFANDKEPNCVVVFGGDGMMLHTIRKHWRRRLPFIGINAGHHGGLLNDPKELPKSLKAFFADLTTYQSAMFFVEFRDAYGRVKTGYAFNDAWIEKTSTQALWLEVRVNDEIKIPRLVSDGFLAASAAGYEGYARAMGGYPLILGAPAFVIVANNPHQPLNWRSAHCSLSSQLELFSLDNTGKKRPMRGVIDGKDMGRVTLMRVRVSRIAAAELAFLPDRDMVRKSSVNAFPLF